MTRRQAIDSATTYFDSGGFLIDLARRVHMMTESQDSGRADDLRAYLADEIVPSIDRMGFESRIVENPVAGSAPFLIATRIEDPSLPTILMYGHGDVVRGHDGQWKDQMSPWNVTVEGDRWFGRGTADNKGQHTINLAALEQVVAARHRRLGFNATLLLEMGEETGSPGLRAVCEQNQDLLAADILIASDGPGPDRTSLAFFSGRAGSSTSRFPSGSGRAHIIPEIGAGRSAMPAPSSPTRSRRSSTGGGGSSLTRCCRRIFRMRCGLR